MHRIRDCRTRAHFAEVRADIQWLDKSLAATIGNCKAKFWFTFILWCYLIWYVCRYVFGHWVFMCSHDHWFNHGHGHGHGHGIFILATHPAGTWTTNPKPRLTVTVTVAEWRSMRSMRYVRGRVTFRGRNQGPSLNVHAFSVFTFFWWNQGPRLPLNADRFKRCLGVKIL